MKKRYLLLIITLLLFNIVLTGCGSSNDKKQELSPSDAVAWTSLRLAIAESKVYGGSTSLSTEHFNLLKQLAKNFDDESDWFGSSEIYLIAYGKTMDTDKYEISSLCSENYCATFKIEHKEGKYYLINYTFEKTTEKGYKIYIIDRDQE